MAALNGLPRPLPDLDTEPFWNGCREGRFLIPSCGDCGSPRWPPGPMCPHCQSGAVEWLAAKGFGYIYSWVVVTHPVHPLLADQVPYVVAMIDLDEGVRVVGNVTGVAPDAVSAGMPVELYFEEPDGDGIPIPNFSVSTQPERGDEMQLSDNTALIVVDMQNGFCHEDGFMNKIGLDWTTSRDAIGPVRRLVDAAHAAGVPVFFTRYTLNEDYSDAGLMREIFPQIIEARGMIRGTWDGEIVDELTPDAEDRVIDKTRYSAFYDTDLEPQLRALGIDTVIVCGVTTNVCVESTVRDAFFRDIRIIVPSDGTAAVSPELHEGALRDFEYSFGPVVTVAELEQALASRASTVRS